MKIDKQIRELPWPDAFDGMKNQHFRMKISQPVVNHERLLVVTFSWNRKNEGEHMQDFRLVCSKKLPGAAVLFKGDNRTKRRRLQEALGGYASYGYPEISAQEEKTLAKWLGKEHRESRNHFLPELADWVNMAIQTEIQRERDERGELRNEDVFLCPEALPEGLETYIRRNVLPNDRTLIYKKGNVRGLCYACGQEVRARNQRFRQNEVTRCPSCDEVVSCYLSGSDRFMVDYVQNIATIQKGEDGKTVFIRQWHLCRDRTARWVNIPEYLEEICRYAVRGDKVAKWQAELKSTYYYATYRSRTNWTRMGNTSEVYDGSYYFFLPENWKSLLSGTSLQYCDLSGYCNGTDNLVRDRNTIRFLMDWARYPAIEKLWKAGYHQLIHKRISCPQKEFRNTIRWNRDSIREAVRFPMRLLKIHAPEDWTMADMQKVTDLWQEVQEGRIQEKDVAEFARSRATMEDIRDALGHASVHRILQYIAKVVEVERKVRKKDNRWDGRPFQTPGTYRDYLKDCIALRLNLDDKDVLFPKDLETAHARTIEEVKHQEDDAKRELFSNEVMHLKWMEWEKDGLLIRLPMDAKELIAEGAYLHHCVGGYAERMARGKTTILLIRRAEEPDTPFYTLEWLNGKVQQCRTVRNASYEKDEQVFDFVNEWVKKIARKGKKRKQATSAA